MSTGKETIEMLCSNSMTTAIAWCLTWGEGSEPQLDLSVLQQMQDALNEGKEEDVPTQVRGLVKQVKRLQSIGDKYFKNSRDAMG